MEIILAQPISPEELLWFLSRGYDEAVYSVYDKSIYRAFRVGLYKVLVKITPYQWMIKIEWLTGVPDADTIDHVKTFINEWFDLDADITAFYDLLKPHAILGYMATAYNGLKLVGMPDIFEALCWAITGQQINLTFAYKLKRRLVEKYGDHIDHAGKRYYLFPSVEAIAGATIADLKEMQFSGSKAAYLISAAQAFASGSISKETLLALAGPNAQREALTSLKGVGVWTANYVLMKSLGDRSAIPYGDAGLLNSLIGHGIIADKKELQGMHDLFEKFKGWEAYLVFYLWRSLAVKPRE